MLLAELEAGVEYAQHLGGFAVAADALVYGDEVENLVVAVAVELKPEAYGHVVRMRGTGAGEG